MGQHVSTESVGSGQIRLKIDAKFTPWVKEAPRIQQTGMVVRLPPEKKHQKILVMTSQSFANRILSAGCEPLRHYSPLHGIFKGLDKDTPPSFVDATKELCSAVLDGRVPVKGQNCPERRESIARQMTASANVALRAANDIKQFQDPLSPLSHDQIAVLHFYTQETDQEGQTDSAYALMNAILRNEDRNVIRNIREYVWLLLTALRLCPSSPVKTVYRGVNFPTEGTVAKHYPNGREITWYQASSCSSTINTLKNPMFLGQVGERVIFSIELNERSRARLVAPYSANKSENEVILPPNTVLRVISQLSLEVGLTIIQMQEVEPFDPILLFEDAYQDYPVVTSLQPTMGMAILPAGGSAAGGEVRGICPVCSEAVTTLNTGRRRDNLGTYFHQGCFDKQPSFHPRPVVPAEQPALASDAEIMFQQGLREEEGRDGMTRDIFRARLSYEAAAKVGHAGAKAALGFFYTNGQGGLPKDEREAFQHFWQASEQGNSRARFGLGLFYENGQGGLVKDEREAARLYRLAAEQGNSGAQFSLGLFHESGQGGLTKDKGEAARLYRLAAEQGNSNARYKLGGYYFNGQGGLKKDEREAMRLYRLAAEQGNSAAQSKLGVFYASGQGGLLKDENEAARLFRLAAGQGNASAQFYLGIMYENGQGGLMKDEREAARLYRCASDQRVGAAHFYLGFFYQTGLGGLAKDEREAARLYRLAAEQGVASAQHKLGVMHENGQGGLAKDEREAARLYRLAAEQGCSGAQRSLGIFYENGQGGLAKDKDEATRLFRLAADRGIGGNEHAKLKPHPM